MDPTDLSDAQLDQLADQLAGRLPSGTHGDRVVLSRRAFAAAVGGTLGASGLVALGVDPAAAQAAGQVGTSADPVDAFVFDLDVANALQSDLDAGGNALTNVRSVSTDEVSVKDSDGEDTGVARIRNRSGPSSGRDNVDVDAYRNDGTWLFVMNAEWNGSDWVKTEGGEAARMFEIGGDGTSHFTADINADAGEPLTWVERNTVRTAGGPDISKRFRPLDHSAKFPGGTVAGQNTEAVATSATPIFTGEGDFGDSYLLVIIGFDGSGNRFRDIVSFTSKIGVPPSTIDSAAEGSPASRTYSRNGSDLELAMGADTYGVSVSGLGSRVDVTA